MAFSTHKFLLDVDSGQVTVQLIMQGGQQPVGAGNRPKATIVSVTFPMEFQESQTKADMEAAAKSRAVQLLNLASQAL